MDECKIQGNIYTDDVVGTLDGSDDMQGNLKAEDTLVGSLDTDGSNIQGAIRAEETLSGTLDGGGRMKGKMDSEKSLVGSVGFPKCVCYDDYEVLENKPQINGVELVGDLSTEDLGIEAGVTSWNGQTGDVVYTPPEVPVQSVNGQTGDVVLDADDVDALPLSAKSNLYYGQVDATSTSKVFTAQIDGITEYTDGLTVILKNGVVTSASGFTININGLGAKPVYSNLAAETRDTTLFNVAYTMMFIYEHRVEGGNWLCYRGYDANTNTIGYQLRTNSQSLPMKSITYRYRLLFTSADREHLVPATNSTSTNATAKRDVCQNPIDPFGAIAYYGTTASVAIDARPGSGYLWQQNVLSLGYSFNRVGTALNLTLWKPVYVKCAPQEDGSAIIDADTPYVQSLPNAEDGKIYIFLGIAYSATNIELMSEHPVYEYKGGMIRLYTNAMASGSTELVTDLGSFDMEEYDWDFGAYLADKTESGFYKVNEEQDGFDYFFRVERTNNRAYQEWWYEEEGSLYRYCRDGYWTGDEWEWNDFTNWVTEEQLNSNFYSKVQVYTKTEVDNKFGGYYTDGEIDEMFDNFSPDTMIETTWANLRSLRDGSQLVKGAWYRITDYNFVTTKLGVQSGNHQFDIVLLAISESMLSESGYACKHAGDHYFEREVTEGGIEWMYTIYVDDYGESYGDEPMDHQDDLHSSDEFCDSGVLTHPNTDDDVPVLYKTDTGEYDIDDPDYNDAYFYEGTYDFDGDEFDMWSKYEWSADDEEWVFMQQYALTPIVVEDGELIVSPIPEAKIVPVNMNAWELKYCLDNDKDLFDWAETEGKGVIYYLKDEFGNEAPYDFKNAMFRRYQVSTVSDAVLNGLRNMYLYQDGYYALTRNSNSKYWYTFASSDGASDGSLFGECTYNVISPYIYLSPKGKNIRGINNIVLQNANRNNFGHNCYDITILTSADGNVFDGSSSDICGVSFARSTFRDSARTVTLYSTTRSIYGASVQSIMGQSVDSCECGNACSNINFGVYNSSLKLGNSCSGITFGQWCYSVDVLNGSTNITFGNYCSYITIGKVCGYITFTNYYRYVAIEDNVTRLTFTTTGGSTSQYVQNVKVCRGINNKSIAPTRRLAYEQIYYASGRVETAL